jgi:hypothetical protein
VQVYYTVSASTNWTLGIDGNGDWCLAPTADFTNPFLRSTSLPGPLHGINVPARVEVNGGDSDSLRIRNANAVPWAIRIKNDAVTAEAALSVNGSGQLLVTNRADLTTPTYAALNDNGTWGTSSDRSLKRMVQPLTGLLKRVCSLRPVSYYLAGQDLAREPARNIGLIAQEVQPLFPSLVHGPEGSKTLDYAGLSVAAIGAIQEQQEIIESQRKQLATLRAEQDRQLADRDQQLARQHRKIDDLETRLARIEKLLANQP